MMLKQLKRHPIYFGLIALLVILAVVFNLSFSKTEGFLLLNGFHTTLLDQFFSYYTFLGDGVFSIIVVIGLFLFKRYRKASTLLLAFLSSSLAAQLLKRLFHLPRPKMYFEANAFQYPHFIEGITLHNSNSFPSGHTTSAFALATVLVLTFKKEKIAWPCLIGASLVAYSRYYLAQHFLQDTIAGALIGTLFGILSYYCVKQKKMRLPFKRIYKLAKSGQLLSKLYGFSTKKQPLIQEENHTAL
ncbi:phosphatase PAP2 family protein [Pedobacter sp. UC225_65]|uniref:phosphatase PAP2 family protein n=1 Tax=Pedobacter sp. UC225_65 TaxID=3350173 RepID=UPI00367349B4